jgi:bifunctional non-homologous end joining protein LigD
MARPQARSAGTSGPGGLERYWAKRDFSKTAEPRGVAAKPGKKLSFVIQKHAATRLHYDFRLELDGVLLSWAVPKGPSFDPKQKRMAIHVEDHPVSYGGFQGSIPKGQYGAGTVILWDRGTWEPVGDPREGMRQGKLVFRLHSEKLAGLWELVRIAKPGDRQDPWILFKKRDEWARPLDEYDVIRALPDSVIDRPLGSVETRDARLSSATREDPASTEPMALAGAVKAKLPVKLSPQLATLTKGSPPAGEWIYEIKFDGYRIMARIEKGEVRLITRGGHDWTDKMLPLAEEIGSLGLDSGWLDGEAVVIDEDGRTSFNALQNAFDSSRTSAISYFVFDVPFLGGYDLRATPLHARKQLLRQLMEGKETDRLRYSDEFPADAQSVVAAACQLKLEGVIAKRRDAPYTSSRSESWLKLKCSERQEFVVVGFTNRAGAPHEVGGLLLGYHEDGTLRYGGSVGTGWDHATGAELHKQLSKIEVTKPSVDPQTVKPGKWSKRVPGTERWVKPQVVVEVSFAEWTPDGHARHPSFQGVRKDKPASAITRERAAPVRKGATPALATKASVRVSNPGRAIDPTTGLTKLDLVRYYESVAEWMLPHLKGRPVSLVRGPTGITGQLFFQKHDDKLSIPGMKELDPSLWAGHAALLEVPNVQAMANAAQMNVIEFHTWNSTAKNIDKPDRMIFDLDPGDGVKWPALQEAAVLTRALLSELGLDSWLKTSGGKGLHVVVPLRAQHDYDTVKRFSQAVVQHLARVIPTRFVAKSGPANRVGKIFVDYLRNGHGATTAAAFSARARPGLGVSVPVAWDELPGLRGGNHWTIATVRDRLSFQKVDPWHDYWKRKQNLTAAMKSLEFQLPRTSSRS